MLQAMNTGHPGSFVKCKRIGRPLWKNRDDHRRVFLYGSRGKDEPSGGTAFS